jgi:hypothetical protein
MLETDLRGSWTWAGKTNAGALLPEGPFQSIANGQTTGTLTFNTPVTTAFAIALKAANNYSVYYFAFPFNQLPLQGGTINMPPLPNSVDFNTYGVNLPNPGGNVNALTHLSIWARGTRWFLSPQPSFFLAPDSSSSLE